MWSKILNVTLRRSILYACETYYNLKENEVRQIERIEESYMRQLLKTTKGCPITQMYLELGQTPARFDIFKLRLLFLKYILDQESDSLIQKFFYLQLEQPTKGDWASACSDNLKDLEINLSMDEIKEMSLSRYQSLVRKKCKEKAINYLLMRRGSKGMEIDYPEIQMAEYLQPNEELTIEQQRQQFEIRNRMVNIPANFSAKNTTKCICNEIENMKHIYNCKYLNKEEPRLEYEKLFNGNISEQKCVSKRFEANMKTRNEYIDKLKEESDHVIHDSDPLYSVSVEYGNG